MERSLICIPPEAGRNSLRMVGGFPETGELNASCQLIPSPRVAGNGMTPGPEDVTDTDLHPGDSHPGFASTLQASGSDPCDEGQGHGGSEHIFIAPHRSIGVCGHCKRRIQIKRFPFYLNPAQCSSK
eukprot:EG_transcript_37641